MPDDPNAGPEALPPKPEAAGQPAAAPPPARAAAPKPPATMVTAPWESELSKELKEQFGDGILETSSYAGQNFAVVKPETAIRAIEFLKQVAGFDYLVDITAVDWPKRAERFDLVYIVYSFARNERVRIKTSVAEGFHPQSAVPVHATANWLEREVFDLFGIEFEGHPDLRRILLPEGWTGHPLRKDHPILQQDRTWVRENVGIESGQ